MPIYQVLPGPKRLGDTLNTDRSQGQDLPSIILPTLSWLSDRLEKKPGPQLSWSLESDGSIWVQKTATKPKRVRLWQATNPNARDFHLGTIGAAWTNTPLAEDEDDVYTGYVPPPPRGWTAFTVELAFPGATVIPTPLESDQIFRTNVRVSPDTLLFQGGACFCWGCLPSWSGWRADLR